MWEKQPCQPPVSVQEESRRCSRHKVEHSCSPGEARGGAGCLPAPHRQHTADFYAQPCRSWWCSSAHGLGEMQPMEEPMVRQEDWGICRLWGAALEQSAPKGWALWYGLALEQYLKNCSQPLGRINLGKMTQSSHSMITYDLVLLRSPSMI